MYKLPAGCALHFSKIWEKNHNFCVGFIPLLSMGNMKIVVISLTQYQYALTHMLIDLRVIPIVEVKCEEEDY